MEKDISLIDIKKADSAYEIHDLIANRYSPRAFGEQPITQDTLNRLFEAVRWAPSSMNAQPWRFIYAFKGEEAHDKLVETLMEGNKPWAKNAPVLILTLVKNHLDNGSPNGSAHHDLGLAVGNLSLQATHEGIGIHQMGGFSKTKAQELFQIDESFDVVTVLALGYFGTPDQLTEPFKSRELAARQRIPVGSFAFNGKIEL